MTTPTPEKFPAGPFDFDPLTEWDAPTKSNLTTKLREIPLRVEEAIDGFDEDALNLKYHNWTLRQIVHHLADSHLNGYVRTKWALTEASPLIKAYNESAWSDLVDAKEHDLKPSLDILRGVHNRWADLLNRLEPEEMGRTYFHPEMAREVKLVESISNYIWHAAHHTAQIHWVRENRLNKSAAAN